MVHKVSRKLLVAAYLVATLFAVGWIALSGNNISAQAILSGSMEPSIRAGTLVISLRRQPQEYSEGMVVTFQPFPEKPEILVTHRITNITLDTEGRQLLVTKGDANTNGDPWRVNIHQVVGSVIIAVPFLGSIVRSSFKVALWVTILVILPLLMLLYAVRNRRLSVT